MTGSVEELLGQELSCWVKGSVTADAESRVLLLGQEIRMTGSREKLLGQVLLGQEYCCWVSSTVAGSREELLGLEKSGWVKSSVARPREVLLGQDFREE